MNSNIDDRNVILVVFVFVFLPLGMCHFCFCLGEEVVLKIGTLNPGKLLPFICNKRLIVSCCCVSLSLLLCLDEFMDDNEIAAPMMPLVLVLLLLLLLLLFERGDEIRRLLETAVEGQ